MERQEEKETEERRRGTDRGRQRPPETQTEFPKPHIPFQF